MRATDYFLCKPIAEQERYVQPSFGDTMGQRTDSTVKLILNRSKYGLPRKRRTTSRVFGAARHDNEARLTQGGRFVLIMHPRQLGYHSRAMAFPFDGHGMSIKCGSTKQCISDKYLALIPHVFTCPNRQTPTTPFVHPKVEIATYPNVPYGWSEVPAVQSASPNTTP